MIHTALLYKFCALVISKKSHASPIQQDWRVRARDYPFLPGQAVYSLSQKDANNSPNPGVRFET